MNINEIDTPALLIDFSKLKDNIKKMQDFSDLKGIKLRPHIKTHKMPSIAKMQIEAGAIGIAVAKLGEAEVFANEGFDDIQIANIIIGEKKIDRLFHLNGKVRELSVCADSIEGVRQLNERFKDSGKQMNVMIEIDSGLGRSGLKDKTEILKLAKEIEGCNGLKFNGILTHAGQVYSANTFDEIQNIANFEVSFMTDIAEFLKYNGIETPNVSIGSTPAANANESLDSITEIRPGNYVFYDMIQVSLGVAKIEQCALSILTTVISKPSNDRVIIDAGSKALHTDRGAHGNDKIKTYGNVLNKNCSILRLSEEHGFIYHNGEQFSIGEKIRIIPNHACAVCNLFDYAYLIEDNKVKDIIEISARGKMT
ncbi:MAG: alanine racemase [Candidatus Kapabacteria bacterium]|nr:alanine racemase [Candidatus Kapabacteria bacterium]